MGYEMDMSKEQEPNAELPEGWRELITIDMVPEVSKKGNDMFVCEFQDVKTGKKKKAWLVSVEGKRWMLKQLLSACGVEKNAEGKFNWDFPDVINKPILGYVQIENETYINREGQEVTKPKSKIVEFKKMEVSAAKTDGTTDIDQVQWQD